MAVLQFIYRNRRKIFLPILLFLTILAVALYSIGLAIDSSGRLQSDMVTSMIKRAMLDCYAVEGYYPASMQYLYDNYNVTVDEEKYLVLYEVFAPNIRPTVRIIDRR